MISTLENLKALIPDRNLIVHGATGITSKGGKKVPVVTNLKNDRFRHNEIPLDEIVSLHLEELRRWLGEFTDLLHEPIWRALCNASIPR